MKKFYAWAALIAATAYLILVGYLYATHPKPITDFTQRDLLQVFGILFALVAIFRLAPRLSESRGKAEDSNCSPVDSAEHHQIHNQSAKAQPSFREAMNKKRGTLAVLFLFSFLLPPLIQLGQRRGIGTVPFSRAYWQSVIIGELLMASCLVVGWFLAKRKYERNLKR
jgi:hypothetical protein